jgi:hypothetical protein
VRGGGVAKPSCICPGRPARGSAALGGCGRQKLLVAGLVWVYIPVVNDLGRAPDSHAGAVGTPDSAGPGIGCKGCKLRRDEVVRRITSSARKVIGNERAEEGAA